MSIVNFSIPGTLEKRINAAIKDKGFASKAEFFRYAAIHLLDVVSPSTTKDELEFERLVNELKVAVINKYKSEEIPSLEEQLS